MGNKDRLNQTPTIVIVANGKRDVIGGITPYPILKSYIDKKLAQWTSGRKVPAAWSGGLW